jgi:Activator of Hsp90 ATPase homolog 1-like protein
MTEQKPFRVEVVVDAPREAVWRALTEPERVARWFGWDYGGLEGEINYIFVDHARREPPGLIVLDDGQDNQTIELVEEGPRTRVICVRPGSLESADWDDLYEDVREGWITFFHQLRHSVERHPNEDRRTVYLTGQAVPADVMDALGRELSGPIWHAGRFQRVVAAGGEGDLLAGIHAKLPIDSSEVGDVSLTVTTYGLDEGAFEALRQRWESWWAGLTRDVAA